MSKHRIESCRETADNFCLSWER